MDMTLYTSKHEAIKQTLSEIRTLSSSVSDNAEKIAGAVGRLSAIVQMHLASEDKFLYPDLLSKTSGVERKIAEKYMEEMKGIEKSFSAFASKYRTTSAVKDESAQFLAEMSNIENALTKRMDREEKELYPLA